MVMMVMVVMIVVVMIVMMHMHASLSRLAHLIYPAAAHRRAAGQV